MTEEEFRRALGAHTDEHIRRLQVLYAFLFQNAGTIIELARNGGVDDSALREIIHGESERMDAALNEILARHTEPRTMQIHQRRSI